MRASGGAVRAALGIAALAAVPFVVGDFWAYQLGLFYLYAIAALGVGVCWGRTGFLPLGQGLFFGLAAYGSGLALIAFEGSPWLMVLIPLAAIAPALLAYALGLLVFRGRRESGPYFSMITLALALLAYQVANNWESVTGGFNGLKGIPGLPGLDGYTAAYFVAATALAASALLVAWLYRAPLGVLWASLAQNERRVVLFGFDTNRLKAVAFGASGLLAGIGGALYAPQQGLVTPQLCGFALSADLVVWAAVGGRGRLLGPALGAVAVGILASELRDRFPYWEIALAIVFILVVLFFPEGLAGMLMPVVRRLGGHEPRAAAVAAPVRPDVERASRLEIDGVEVRVGEVTILDRLALAIERSAIHCVIGPNGAGKTSTFNVLTGELPVQAGSVRFDGHALHRLPAHRIVRLGIGRKFQIPSVFPRLAIGDHLAIALWSARARPLDLLKPSLRRWSTPLLEALRERYPFLRDDARPAAALSHGERQILELAMALLGEPRLLLLDEPCAGLSPQETAAVIDVIRWASAQRRATIVVIEHDMALVRHLAEHVFVLHNGRLLAQGSVAQVQADPAVQAIYVGSEK